MEKKNGQDILYHLKTYDSLEGKCINLVDAIGAVDHYLNSISVTTKGAELEVMDKSGEMQKAKKEISNILESLYKKEYDFLEGEKKLFTLFQLYPWLNIVSKDKKDLSGMKENECPFEIDLSTSSATKCKLCVKENWEHGFNITAVSPEPELLDEDRVKEARKKIAEILDNLHQKRTDWIEAEQELFKLFKLYPWLNSTLSPDKTEEEAAILFANWLEENYTFMGDGYKAKDNFMYNSFVESLEELYQIFKTETKG